MRKIISAAATLGFSLAICGELSAQSPSIQPGSDLLLLTDIERIEEPLGEIVKVKVVPDSLYDASLHYEAGVISYTPLPEGWRPRPHKIPLPDPLCRLVLCGEDGKPVPDPRLGSITGQDFVAVYATPAFVEVLVEQGMHAVEIKKLNALTLADLLSDAGFKFAGSGKYVLGDYIPGSPLHRYCTRRPVPRICTLIDVGDFDELDPFELDPDIGLVVTDYRGLTEMVAVDQLVQLHGEGVAPVLSPVRVAFPENVDESAAMDVLERLYSVDGQLELARSGIIPVGERAFSEAVTPDVAVHLEEALMTTHGGVGPGPVLVD